MFRSVHEHPLSCQRSKIKLMTFRHKQVKISYPPPFFPHAFTTGEFMALVSPNPGKFGHDLQRTDNLLALPYFYFLKDGK